MLSVELCSRICVLVSDVDGVMTDGRIIYDAQGIESKEFFIRDGMGVRLWREAGFKFGIVTARNSPIVERRARELKVDYVCQGNEAKLGIVEGLASDLGIELDQIGYLGDDLLDLQTIQAVGLGVAVADAVAEVRDAADYVTAAVGGRGAVREVVETILTTTGCWEEVVNKYSAD